MTTVAPRLHPLRRQLTALHQARQANRQQAAWSAVGISVLVALGTLWALDVVFELSVAQRVIMLALGAAAIFSVYRRFAASLLAQRESLLEVALQVERRHGIDTDLVAALQFESPDAPDWGSPQLETAVIDRVADGTARLEVFAGFSRALANGRLLWLGICAVGLLIAAAMFPGHARVFWNRLWLGSDHYPSQTRIERIAINDQLVLVAALQKTSPRRSAAAQSRPLMFLVQAQGVRPSSGQVRISSLRGGTTRPVNLAELTLDERRARLTEALQLLTAPEATGETSRGPVVDDATLLPYLDCDAPDTARLWRLARDSQATWDEVRRSAEQSLANWERTAGQSAVYRGELGRLVESIEFKVFLGDAWTDAAEVAMTPRPVVEPRLQGHAPDYTAGVETVRELGPGRLTVLEGSSVDVALECTNGKRLREAWLTWLSVRGPRRWNLRPAAGSPERWTLDPADTPFVQVTEDVRFELQVRDEDGLTLETPLAGLVRVQPDRAPSASLQLVHRVVLPQARPQVQCRVLDDFGIARIDLHLQVERRRDAVGGPNPPAATPATATPSAAENEESAAGETTVSLLEPGRIVRGAELPWNKSRPVELQPLRLQKGDRLTLVLEVTDDRGTGMGRSFRSEPVSLEVSDEAGVLSSVLEADQRAEERLSEIIKRQLGIGESP
ncbi:MAG: hypothetical protein U0935_23795 [Pirellulales bacterium]